MNLKNLKMTFWALIVFLVVFTICTLVMAFSPSLAARIFSIFPLLACFFVSFVVGFIYNKIVYKSSNTKQR